MTLGMRGLLSGYLIAREALFGMTLGRLFAALAKRNASESQ